PYDNPEVAFSVVVPWLHNDKSGINSIIGKEVLDVYFDLKKQRMHDEAASTDTSNQN
ncbi:TPA: penicillin-binding protein transpeptidase, partial [Bacillus anthracis]|nr:penicillin-binding protein transpeptidase [Bacillus anthracis]